MKIQLYSYYDKCAGTFSSPIPAVNEACASRTFVNNCLTGSFPDDQSLYYIGTYDTDTGEITPAKVTFIRNYTESEV